MLKVSRRSYEKTIHAMWDNPDDKADRNRLARTQVYIEAGFHTHTRPERLDHMTIREDTATGAITIA